MATVIRAEISKRNPYWIEKHRYYELKHFCLQYSKWKEAYLALNGFGNHSVDLSMFKETGVSSDPTAKCAIAKVFYSERMDMLKRVAEKTDPVLASYILKAVTEGLSYDILKARLGIACCKDVYYGLYRRFFWLLSSERK